MYTLTINDYPLYYTEVQVASVNFWLVAEEPFITAGSRYVIYHCKEYTLLDAVKSFYTTEIEPQIIARNRRSRQNRYLMPSELVIPITSRYMHKVAEKLKKQDPEAGVDNINAI
jgi:hypothetical protein